MQFRSVVTVIAALGFSASAYALDYKVGALHIKHPYARATVPNQPAGAAYLGIENKGKRADKLIAVSSPIAASTQIHTMSMDDGVMKMREVSSIEIKPLAAIVMAPGAGYHIMLIGLKQPLKIGDEFPLRLTFAKAGKLEVSVVVQEVKAPSAASMEAGHTHKH